MKFNTSITKDTKNDDDEGAETEEETTSGDECFSDSMVGNTDDDEENEEADDDEDDDEESSSSSSEEDDNDGQNEDDEEEERDDDDDEEDEEDHELEDDEDDEHDVDSDERDSDEDEDEDDGEDEHEDEEEEAEASLEEEEDDGSKVAKGHDSLEDTDDDDVDLKAKVKESEVSAVQTKTIPDTEDDVDNKASASTSETLLVKSAVVSTSAAPASSDNVEIASSKITASHVTKTTEKTAVAETSAVAADTTSVTNAITAVAADTKPAAVDEPLVEIKRTEELKEAITSQPVSIVKNILQTSSTISEQSADTISKTPTLDISESKVSNLETVEVVEEESNTTVKVIKRKTKKTIKKSEKHLLSNQLDDSNDLKGEKYETKQTLLDDDDISITRSESKPIKSDLGGKKDSNDVSINNNEDESLMVVNKSGNEEKENEKKVTERPLDKTDDLKLKDSMQSDQLLQQLQQQLQQQEQSQQKQLEDQHQSLLQQVELEERQQQEQRQQQLLQQQQLLEQQKMLKELQEQEISQQNELEMEHQVLLHQLEQQEQSTKQLQQLAETTKKQNPVPSNEEIETKHKNINQQQNVEEQQKKLLKELQEQEKLQSDELEMEHQILLHQLQEQQPPKQQYSTKETQQQKSETNPEVKNVQQNLEEQQKLQPQEEKKSDQQQQQELLKELQEQERLQENELEMEHQILLRQLQRQQEQNQKEQLITETAHQKEPSNEQETLSEKSEKKVEKKLLQENLEKQELKEEEQNQPQNAVQLLQPNQQKEPEHDKQPDEVKEPAVVVKKKIIKKKKKQPVVEDFEADVPTFETKETSGKTENQVVYNKKESEEKSLDVGKPDAADEKTDDRIILNESLKKQNDDETVTEKKVKKVSFENVDNSDKVESKGTKFEKIDEISTPKVAPAKQIERETDPNISSKKTEETIPEINTIPPTPVTVLNSPMIINKLEETGEQPSLLEVKDDVELDESIHLQDGDKLENEDLKRKPGDVDNLVKVDEMKVHSSDEDALRNLVDGVKKGVSDEKINIPKQEQVEIIASEGKEVIDDKDKIVKVVKFAEEVKTVDTNQENKPKIDTYSEVAENVKIVNEVEKTDNIKTDDDVKDAPKVITSTEDNTDNKAKVIQVIDKSPENLTEVKVEDKQIDDTHDDYLYDDDDEDKDKLTDLEIPKGKPEESKADSKEVSDLDKRQEMLVEKLLKEGIEDNVKVKVTIKKKPVQPSTANGDIWDPFKGDREKLLDESWDPFKNVKEAKAPDNDKTPTKPPVPRRTKPQMKPFLESIDEVFDPKTGQKLTGKAAILEKARIVAEDPEAATPRSRRLVQLQKLIDQENDLQEKLGAMLRKIEADENDLGIELAQREKRLSYARDVIFSGMDDEDNMCLEREEEEEKKRKEMAKLRHSEVESEIESWKRASKDFQHHFLNSIDNLKMPSDQAVRGKENKSFFDQDFEFQFAKIKLDKFNLENGSTDDTIYRDSPDVLSSSSRASLDRYVYADKALYSLPSSLTSSYYKELELDSPTIPTKVAHYPEPQISQIHRKNVRYYEYKPNDTLSKEYGLKVKSTFDGGDVHQSLPRPKLTKHYTIHSPISTSGAEYRSYQSIEPKKEFDNYRPSSRYYRKDNLASGSRSRNSSIGASRTLTSPNYYTRSTSLIRSRPANKYSVTIDLK